MASPRDTIFALSSGRGVAAVAVIRISGPRADEALQILTGRMPPARKAALVTIRNAQREEIDQALALWFPAPHSETGENVAELQVHGGRAVVAAVLAALGRLKGLRPAEAGEFTRRAFENAKLDLTRIEGLADLVMAETEAQRRQAFAQLKGLLGDRSEVWRGRLIAALALVEARIDFSDEADVPEDLLTPALRIARELADEVETVLAQGRRGERLRDGLTVAIAGPPNAGKSTLLNRIARREAAIVSPYAGTTRDVIEVHLDLEGYPVTLLDTAGIRESADPVEQEGVRRARERASAADLVLWVVDGSEPLAEGAGGGSTGLVAEPGLGANQARWTVENKADLLAGRNESDSPNNELTSDLSFAPVNSPLTRKISDALTALPGARNESQSSTNETEISPSGSHFRLSAITGQGVDPLLTALARQAAAHLGAGEPALLTRERHRHALETVAAALRRALAGPAAGREDLVAEELRLAANALGKLTGRIDVEDILDVIFRDFCIGK
jgi:tRNA modification GTPase